MRLLTRAEEMLLIAIWRLGDNAYGVTIRDKVNEMTGQDWSFGQVYVPLDALTSRNLISKNSSAPTAERGGRSKCMYQLTPEGKAALKAVRAVQDALWDGLPLTALD